MKNLLIALSYNNAEYLVGFLKSLMMQNIDNWDVVIIDDFSSDNSSQILNSFDFEGRDIRVVQNNENIGINRSIILGLDTKNSKTGFFVKIIGTDDVLAPGALDIFSQVSRKYDFAYSDGYLIDADGEIFGNYETASPAFFDYKFRSLASYTNYYPAPTALIKSEILREALSAFQGIKNAEDWPVLVTLVKASRKICKIPFKTVYYRRHRKSLSISFFDKKIILPIQLAQDIQAILNYNCENERNLFIRFLISQRIRQLCLGRKNFYRLFHLSFLIYKLSGLMTSLIRGIRKIKNKIKKKMKNLGVAYKVNYKRRIKTFGKFAVNDLSDNNDYLESVCLSQLAHYKREISSICGRRFVSVLDFGCGPGKFISLFEAIGEGKKFGYDPARELLNSTLGYDQVYSDLSKIGGEFDLIFVNNVIGGLDKHEVEEFESFCRRRLSSNGVLCVVEVPIDADYAELSWNSVDLSSLRERLQLSEMGKFFFYEKQVRLTGLVMGR
jgi:glycosyltransferase involved in cell wall biosynthesis